MTAAGSARGGRLAATLAFVLVAAAALVLVVVARRPARERGGSPIRGLMAVPPGAPVKEFWAVIVYDPQTRFMLRNAQMLPEISSQKPGSVINPDTFADVPFGPAPPPVTAG